METQKNPFRRFTITAKADKTAEIYLYDQIGQSFWGDGITAKQFAEQLNAVGKVDSVLLRLNSPGGDVFEGAAIYDLITQSKIPVYVRVDGLAASAAFTVAMGGKSIEIGEAGMMMMHNARGMAWGTAKDMEQTAEVLNKVSDQMAGLYAKRSGMPVADVKKLMDDETWMTPDECVAKGFANFICQPDEEGDPKMEMAACFDLEKAYRKVPEHLKQSMAIAANARMSQVHPGTKPDISPPQSGLEKNNMDPTNGTGTPPPAASVEVRAPYGSTAVEIMKLGKEYDVRVDGLIAQEATFAEAHEHIAKEYLRNVREQQGRTAGLAQPTVSAMTGAERRSYSVARAILQMVDGTDKGGREREVSDSIAKDVGRQPRGMFIPTRLQVQATGLDTKTDAAGKYTIATEVRDLIELLRNRTKVIQAGATVLSGLSSNIQFPRQLTGTTGSWVAENPGSDVAQVDATFGVLTLSPKTYQSTTAFSRQLLAQSTIDVENFVRTDISTYHAIALDYAALMGLGNTNQPLGILKTTGIGDVAMGTNGAKITYAKMVELETNIATANADEAGMSFLTTPGIRGVLRCVGQLDQTTSPIPTWTQPGDSLGVGSVLGYPARVSNQVPSTLVKAGSGAVCHAVLFGYWPTVLIGEWGVLDLVVDPYALKKQGMIEVTSFQMVDIGVRQPASMAAIQDAKIS